MISGISSNMNSIGSMDSTQRPKRGPKFEEIDSDGNGSLNSDEFSAISDKISSDTGLSSEELFSKIDSDQDGTISEKEMGQMRPPRGGKRPPMNGGGKATSQNFDMFAKKMEETSGKSIDDILEMLDNKDTDNDTDNNLSQELANFLRNGNNIIDAFA